MEPEGSLPHSQEPTASPYREPDLSTPFYISKIRLIANSAAHNISGIGSFRISILPYTTFSKTSPISYNNLEKDEAWNGTFLYFSEHKLTVLYKGM
jgi:hypothetical protein